MTEKKEEGFWEIAKKLVEEIPTTMKKSCEKADEIIGIIREGGIAYKKAVEEERAAAEKAVEQKNTEDIINLWGKYTNHEEAAQHNLERMIERTQREKENSKIRNDNYKWFRKSTVGTLSNERKSHLKNKLSHERYKKAAEKGFANAQYRLGSMYENGQGVPQDYKEAGKWYRLAAEQGNEAAQYNLERMIEHTQRQPEGSADEGNAQEDFNQPKEYSKKGNDKEAFKLQKKAAEQSLTDTQRNLSKESSRQSRLVSPPIDQLDKLRQPLTDGERIVFDLFNAHLPIEWEIYLQPHLNGLRPDFVLLHPKVGIAVFEVKDWNLQAMQYRVEERPKKAPVLLGEKGGKQFSLQNQNPIEKIYRYKQEIHELYCPRIDGKSGFAAITAGVIFPFATDESVKQLFSKSLSYRGMGKYPAYNPLTGADSVQAGNINAVFPESLRKSSKLMNDDLAKDLRNWLVEPDFSTTQRQPIELDRTQLSFVKTRTRSGYRRIKGPAGSGKSLVLAARAAELLGEGKEVLVVTYNITLLNYLMDISVRWPQSGGKTRENITWLNFHYWCKRMCKDNDSGEEYDDLWGENKDKDRVLNIDLPKLVSTILDDPDVSTPSYDAVLVDEGQDFMPSWWNVLRKVCKENGEMLLVADATQDIYDTANSWTDEAMNGAGFSGGKWAELNISYRLPPLAIEYSRKFAEQFLPKNTVDLPLADQGHLNLYPCTLKWVHTKKDFAAQVCREELFSLTIDAEPDLVSIPDIIFLSDTIKRGLDVVSEIRNKGVESCHTFSEDRSESRRKKMGFYMGDARIKATTLHSFKGWESRAIVIFIGQSVDKKSLALIYTGLTRLKRHEVRSYLTIVSCADELISYGKTWPKYVEKIA
jgi:hypothetical protein